MSRRFWIPQMVLDASATSCVYNQGQGCTTGKSGPYPLKNKKNPPGRVFNAFLWMSSPSGQRGICNPAWSCLPKNVSSRINCSRLSWSSLPQAWALKVTARPCAHTAGAVPCSAPCLALQINFTNVSSSIWTVYVLLWFQRETWQETEWKTNSTLAVFI